MSTNATLEKVRDNLIALCLLFTGLTLILLPGFLSDIFRFYSSTSWPIVEAEVLVSNEECGVGFIGGGLGYECEREFEYEYTVHDEVFHREKVEAFSFFELISELPLPKAGSTIMVFVHPEVHSRAIVYPGILKSLVSVLLFPSITFFWLCWPRPTDSDITKI